MLARTVKSFHPPSSNVIRTRGSQYCTWDIWHLSVPPQLQIGKNYGSPLEEVRE